MHYVLRCAMPQNEKGERLLEIDNCFEVGNVWNWRDGLMLEPDERDVPIPINIDFTPLRGYEGPPVELRDLCIPIMSKRLADAILSCGVDNVDFFPAVLANTLTGEQFDYRAFKVVGLISGADMQKSEWKSFDDKAAVDVSFTKLSVDQDKLRDLPIFRLAENINALMVSEAVKTAILDSGIDTVEFVDPENWVHL